MSLMSKSCPCSPKFPLKQTISKRLLPLKMQSFQCETKKENIAFVDISKADKLSNTYELSIKYFNLRRQTYKFMVNSF